MREAGVDFQKSKDYDWIKSEDLPKENKWNRKESECHHVGYAGYYLAKILHTTGDEGDAPLYRKLVDIDTGLGTKASDQLIVCLRLTSRPEFIKVRIYFFLNYSPSQI